MEDDSADSKLSKLDDPELSKNDCHWWPAPDSL